MKHKNFDSVYAYGYFIVRISDNTKYVGVRYANVKHNLTPNQDFGKVYFTSGQFKKEFKKNPENFKFRICQTFDTREEMWQWEKRIVLRIYKKPDWANNGWGTNYGDNPEISRLISEGKSRRGRDGKTSTERGAEKLKEWIWNTEEGEKWRKHFSDLQKEVHSKRTPEQVEDIHTRRVKNTDTIGARAKAHVTMSQIGEDGLTGNQRKAIKAAETSKLRGSHSNCKEVDNLYNKMLGEMSEEEFEVFCSTKCERAVKINRTRRSKYLSQIEQ